LLRRDGADGAGASVLGFVYRPQPARTKA